MRKIKITPIIVATLFITSAFAILSAAAELEGNIEVEIKELVGLVVPKINLSVNQTDLSPLKVDVEEGNESNNEPDRYYLNDTLSIKINVTDNSYRDGFILPRYLFATVFIMRDKDSVPLSPLKTFFKRLIPVKMFPLGKSKNKMRVDVTSKGDKYLNITMGYEVKNDTKQENLTMHIIVMGMFPGWITGSGEKQPIVIYKKVNLIDVVYDIPE